MNVIDILRVIPWFDRGCARASSRAARLIAPSSCPDLPWASASTTASARSRSGCYRKETSDDQQARHVSELSDPMLRFEVVGLLGITVATTSLRGQASFRAPSPRWCPTSMEALTYSTVAVTVGPRRDAPAHLAEASPHAGDGRARRRGGADRASAACVADIGWAAQTMWRPLPQDRLHQDHATGKSRAGWACSTESPRSSFAASRGAAPRSSRPCSRSAR